MIDLSSDVAAIGGLVPGDTPSAAHLTLAGSEQVAASAFDVDGVLAASAAYCIASADAVGSARGVAPAARELDLDHLLAFCTTHVEVDGAPVPAWADLSGVYPDAHGRHLQIHCNFAHHADGVVRLLGCGADRESVAAAIATHDAFALEAALIDAGMIGATIRTLDEWADHPHAVATRGLPLVSVEQIAPAEPLGATPVHPGASAAVGPLAGIRVVDCSRVLAGPVAGQMLAGSGADVLRVGADHLPSIPVGVMSTGFGKRNTSIDLRTAIGVQAIEALIASGDVWIDAYRPGALASFGLTPERAAELRPGIVVVQVSAFDWVGPWAGRRGFDSIVQSTTGVRWAGGEYAVDDRGEPHGDGPVGLPVQALDYATGFLAAGVAAQLVAHQRRVGGSWLGRVSLLRTRDWLVGRAEPRRFRPARITVADDLLVDVESDFGRLRTVRPIAGGVGSPPQRLGSSPAVWRG